MQTQQVSLSPRYIRPDPGQASGIGGYTATNTLTIKVRDVGAASNALTAAVNAGGNNTRINSVGLSIDDDADLLKSRPVPVPSPMPRTRAQQYASLAKDDLGPVLSIDEQVSSASPRRTPARRGRRIGAHLPGEQTLTFTVTVSFSSSSSALQ